MFCRICSALLSVALSCNIKSDMSSEGLRYLSHLAVCIVRWQCLRLVHLVHLLVQQLVHDARQALLVVLVVGEQRQRELAALGGDIRDRRLGNISREVSQNSLGIFYWLS